ncbi:MAG: DUF4118 domain-containing protein [Anaerocolumna sp.]
MFHIKKEERLNLKLSVMKNLFVMILIMFFCTSISLIFKYVDMFESNFIMIYLLGILLFSYFAGGYLYSFAASIVAVLLYNFFFTEPYYTLQVYNPDYPITFIVMFAVGYTTSMLTIRVKNESQMVIEREERIAALYVIGKNLLEVSSIEQLARITTNKIAIQFYAYIIVQFYDATGNIRCREVEGEDLFEGEIDKTAMVETYQSGSPCGYGTNLFSEAKGYYTPILSQNGVLGIIGIALRNQKFLSSEQKAFISAIVPQVAVVLERERLYEKQQEVQLQIQGERLRTDMLRSISHDLRTPLTGIMGLTSTVLSNYDKIDDTVKKEFLSTIYNDADWLNELVENILQTTRLEEGTVKLNIGQEAAEEIITEAVAHVNKRAIDYKISVNIPREIILLEVDGILIRQVLINLLNNAINYSPGGSEITVSTFIENDSVFFEVTDNGPGISQADIPHIFERYYHRNSKNASNRKGIGIGLALCKSIIEVHGGKITIRNRVPHGTIASFYIPLKG